MVTKFDRLLLIFKTASTWRKRHGGWYRNLVGSLQRVRHSLYNKHADAFSSSFCEAKRADSVSLRLHWHNKSIIRLSYLHKWATTNFECRPHGSGHNRDNTETQSFQQHRCYGFGKIRPLERGCLSTKMMSLFPWQKYGGICTLPVMGFCLRLSVSIRRPV